MTEPARSGSVACGSARGAATGTLLALERSTSLFGGDALVDLVDD